MISKVFIGREKRLSFTCPRCHLSKSVSADRFANIQRAARIKVRCHCGHHYRVDLEKRKYYRKAAKLSGTYAPADDTNHLGRIIKPITVVNISRSGLRFKTLGKPQIGIGDRLWIEFKLDNRERTRIKKKADVKNIDGDFVGVEFVTVSTSDSSDKAIAFYLF